MYTNKINGLRYYSKNDQVDPMRYGTTGYVEWLVVVTHANGSTTRTSFSRATDPDPEHNALVDAGYQAARPDNRSVRVVRVEHTQVYELPGAGA